MRGIIWGAFHENSSIAQELGSKRLPFGVCFGGHPHRIWSGFGDGLTRLFELRDSGRFHGLDAGQHLNGNSNK